MSCPHCSAVLDRNALFCPQCGERLQADAGDPGGAASEDGEPPTVAERFQQAAASRREREDDGETTVWSGTFSQKAMIGWWIGAGAATILALVLGMVFQMPGGGWLPLLGIVVLGWLVLAGWYFYRRFSVYYQLTTQRLTHQIGLLWRRTERIELIDIDDVTVQQGPLERLFQVGTIQIHSSDKTDPEIDLPGIDDVQEVARQIDDLRRQERRRRGLHIEAV